MTAFDQAWDLVKMPVVPGTLHQAGENRWLADFLDPVSQEVLPLEVTEEPHRWGEEAEEKIGEPGRGKRYSRIAGTDSNFVTTRHGLSEVSKPRASAEHEMDLDDEQTFRGRSVHTEKDFRRRGYASALYDALAAILYRDYNTDYDKTYPEKRRPYAIEPEWYGLTEDGEMFWEGHGSDPWLPDNMKELWRE